MPPHMNHVASTSVQTVTDARVSKAHDEYVCLQGLLAKPHRAYSGPNVSENAQQHQSSLSHCNTMLKV